MGSDYNLGWGKGMDPKVNPQRGKERDFYLTKTQEKRLEYETGLWLKKIWVPWNAIPSRTPVPLSCIPTLI